MSNETTFVGWVTDEINLLRTEHGQERSSPETDVPHFLQVPPRMGVLVVMVM